MEKFILFNRLILRVSDIQKIVLDDHGVGDNEPIIVRIFTKDNDYFGESISFDNLSDANDFMAKTLTNLNN
jgi:hypothetical protein